tara:strand:+ start:36885 stop:37319 length:435 start_codon:yes stop_codon:yes gene_type:complete
MSYKPGYFNALNYITLSSKQEQVSNLSQVNFNDHTDSGVIGSDEKKDMLGNCISICVLARTKYSTGNANSSNQEYASSKSYYLSNNTSDESKLGRVHSRNYSQSKDYSEYSFDFINELNITQNNNNSVNQDIVDYSYLLFFRTF